jgi:hypothetical protein
MRPIGISCSVALGAALFGVNGSKLVRPAINAITAQTEIVPQADGHKTFLADNRVNVTEPRASLLLAENNDVGISITGPLLTTINVTQKVRGSDSPFFEEFYGGIANVPVQGGAAGHYITVIPLRLGTVEFNLFGRFADGGIFFKKFTAQVEPTSHVPVRLVISSGTQPGRSTPWIVLLAGNPHGGVLVPGALYSGIPELIQLDDHFVQFKIRSKDSIPAIDLNEATGRVTPVHAGFALVESSFGGVTTLLCVAVVERREDFHANLPVCKDLLAPGERLQPIE